MNPYEPRAVIVHREAARAVDIHVWRRTRSSEQALKIHEVDGVNSVMEWIDAPEGAEVPPTLTLSEEVYSALRTAVVGNQLEEREFLRGRLQEMEAALTIERNRVDRMLP